MKQITPNEIYQGLIKEGVPEKDARILVATAKSESGLNTNAAGDGGKSIGYFQIYMNAHYPKLMQWTGSARESDWITWLKVPENNVKAAAAVYHSQGLGAWTEYKNGHYEKYMDIVDTSAPVTASKAPPGTTISAYTPTSWETLKNKVLDGWYALRGTTRQIQGDPSYPELLQAKQNYNAKYNVGLDTSNEEAAAEYVADTSTFGKIISSSVLAVFIIIVIIIGSISFFKAFNVTAPDVPGISK